MSAPMPPVPLLGYQVFPGDADACNAEIAAWVREGKGARWLACMNPHSYVEALRRPPFGEALRGADWLVADGAGVTLASRVLGAGIGPRVTGSDVFAGVSRLLDASGGARVFFLGSTEETLVAIREKVAGDFPRLTVAGTLSPPFRPEFSEAELDAMAAAVNASGADVLWVGLGAPKQELLLHRLAPRLDVRFAAAVGAVFDFYTGRVKRSHPVFQRLGMEWLPRLLQEPRRLWRRMFVSAPIFLWHVARARWRGTAIDGGRAER